MLNDVAWVLPAVLAIAILATGALVALRLRDWLDS
jgi:hypothetical protein